MKPYTKYQKPEPSGFTQEDFFKFFPIWVYVKQVTPLGGTIFDPKALI